MATVFISYSHLDEGWKDRVQKQLKVLETAGIDLVTWEDRRISAGSDWRPEIEQAIDDCDVAVLLVSKNFLTSGFIMGNEVPALLQRRLELTSDEQAIVAKAAALRSGSQLPFWEALMLSCFGEQRDFRRRQRFLRRHREIVIEPAHGLDEQAFVRLSGHNRRPGIAAVRPAAARVERQPALHLSRIVRVTLETALFQNRPNFLLEKGIVRRKAARAERECEREKDETFW